MTIERTFLFAEGINAVPRVLGLCDRNPDSDSFGCCDRYFWHYRLTDFPNARFQEAGWLFALAYVAAVEGNRFHGKARLKEWTRGAWRFWLRNRNADGSLPELYPFERCFCATAFSAWAFVETVATFGDVAGWKQELAAAAPTMAWLAANANADVFNQMAGSCAALAGYARLTATAEAQRWAQQRCEQMTALATGEGVLPEYGGFDAGYQSLSLSALDRARAFVGGDTALDALVARSGACLRARIAGADHRPDNSRNTQYLFPCGLAAGGGGIGDFENQVEDGVYLRPSWMDDRYCISLAIDFLRAAKGAELRVPGP